MSESEAIQSLSVKLKALEDRLSVLLSSTTSETRQVAQGCAQQVNDLRRQLAEFADQQAAMVSVLRELFPDFGPKLEEMCKTQEKQTRDMAKEIVQNFSGQHSKKPI